MASLSELKTREVVSNIRKIREFRNYTQDYLAAKLGISQNAYSKIELGYSNITLNRLIEISEILEVDLIALIKHNSGVQTHAKLIDGKNFSSGIN
jgi:transcriptional regulator with XRE-family HTH domain